MPFVRSQNKNKRKTTSTKQTKKKKKKITTVLLHYSGCCFMINLSWSSTMLLPKRAIPISLSSLNYVFLHLWLYACRTSLLKTYPLLGVRERLIFSRTSRLIKLIAQLFDHYWSPKEDGMCAWGGGQEGCHTVFETVRASRSCYVKLCMFSLAYRFRLLIWQYEKISHQLIHVD